MDETKYDDYLMVETGSNLKNALTHANLGLEGCLFELLDNALPKNDDFVLINITVGYSVKKSQASFVEVADTSIGMDKFTLAKALGPGHEPTEKSSPLGQNGIGVNMALGGLGDLEYIVTKTKDAAKAIYCDKYEISGQIGITYTDNFDRDHGTIIRITNIREGLIRTRKNEYAALKNNIGARYRYYLIGKETPPNAWRSSLIPVRDPRIQITFTIIDIDNNNQRTDDIIEPIFPVYFHPDTKENKPLVEKMSFEGKEWNAFLAAGYAPHKSTASKLGIVFPHYDPYGVRPGFDVVLHDRIIAVITPEELGIYPQSYGNSWAKLRGEIYLKNGFKKKTTSDNVSWDRNWNELKTQIKKYLEDINYGGRAPVKEESEADIVYKIAKLIRMWPGVKEVKTGVKPNEPAWPIDIVAIFNDDSRRAYEVRVTPTSSADHIFQAFGRLADMSYGSKAYAIGRAPSKDANQALDFIKNETKFEVEFIKLENFNL